MYTIPMDRIRLPFCLRTVVLAFAAALLMPVAVRATNLTVDCTLGTPGAFTTIGAALNSLPVNSASEPHTITVTGPCNENIFIFERQRITIQAASGTTATINAANAGDFVLNIFGSRGIQLSGLTLQGGSTGLLVNEGSDVDIQNCTIQNNSADGIDVQIGSILGVENSTIQNNAGTGLSDAGSSMVTLATFPDQRIKIIGNGGDGIDMDGSNLQVNFGTLSVDSNAGDALFMNGGRLLVFGGGTGGGNVFQNNGGGIVVANAASASFGGSNMIRKNGDYGLTVAGSSATFNGRMLPNGTLNATTIEEHAIAGVIANRLGDVRFGGPHRIQHNGGPTADPHLRAGIQLNRSSLTLTQGVEVINNIGPGILADVNSSTTLTSASISNNAGQGIKLIHQSVAGFSQPLTITGNVGASIFCDDSSLAFGNFTGITHINCERKDHD